MGYIYVEDLEQDIEIGKPSVQLVGKDGNAWNLLNECKQAMKKYQREADSTYNAKYMFKELMDAVMQAESYERTLQIMMGYCDVH